MLASSLTHLSACLLAYLPTCLHAFPPSLFSLFPSSRLMQCPHNLPLPTCRVLPVGLAKPSSYIHPSFPSLSSSLFPPPIPCRLVRCAHHLPLPAHRLLSVDLAFGLPPSYLWGYCGCGEVVSACLCLGDGGEGMGRSVGGSGRILVEVVDALRRARGRSGGGAG